MSEGADQKFLQAKKIESDYPLIDNDPHIRRVIKYMRKEDYAFGAAFAALPPVLMYGFEHFSPSYVGKGGFAPIMRLSVFLGLGAGFLAATQQSTLRFYGAKENEREIEMDMREMVDKVKKGEPLYGVSSLSPYMQGVAARNSRYTALNFHLIPWFNFVNHNQHGVDTAKYYRQAEKELEAERLAKEGN